MNKKIRVLQMVLCLSVLLFTFRTFAATPFPDSYAYSLITENLESGLEGIDYESFYDETAETFYIIFGGDSEWRDLMLLAPDVLTDPWNSLRDSYVSIASSVRDLLSLTGYDHVTLVVAMADQQNENLRYTKDETMLYVVNGVVKYDLLHKVDDMGSLTEYGMGVSIASDMEEDTSNGEEPVQSVQMKLSALSSSAMATAGEKAAVDKAESYLQISAFSHDGLVDQLEYEGFSKSEAEYGADHCGADWFEQAQQKAKSYLNISAFSYTGLIDQLEYEGFTHEQAKYGVDNCNADWYEQAVEKGKSYRRLSSFSRDALIDQLEYEGFTHEQAVHGADNS